jgi:hypothetical protein
LSCAMAVLIEGISVLVRTSAIHDRYPGGWAAFAAQVPNQSLCSDNELARVGFMTPADCASFIGDLERVGILHLKDGKSQDIVVADQMRGFTNPCEWAEFGSIEMNPRQRVSAAQLKDTTRKQIFCPDGWSYEGSLSQQFGFVPTGQQDKSLKFLRREDGLEVYLNILTGEEVYVGRTNPLNND